MSMDRRTAVRSLGALTGSVFAASARLVGALQNVDRRPNFLLVVVDDLRYDEYGAGGHPYLRTPNIDLLAAEGVTFENMFHATPLCSSNRASILTGEYASRHGIYGNVDRSRLSRSLRTVTKHLHEAGYQTGHVGKWHMGDDPTPRPGYDYWVSFPAQGRIVDPDLWEDGRLHRVKGYITDILTDRALTFVSKIDQRKPFFLYVGHKAVHPDVVQRNDGSLDLSRGMNYIAAEKYAGRYSDAMYRRAPTAIGPISRRPKSLMIEHILSMKESREIQDRFPGVLDPGTSEETIRARAEMMLSVDESIGILLERLRKRRDLDNTVIIFTSDNGFFFGEHGLSIERRLPYEESIRMPVVLRHPPLAKAGARIAELGSSTDIAPTILDLAGIDIPSHCQGKSLKSALDGVTVAHGRSAILTEYFSHDHPMPWVLDADYKSIRTAQYKFIHWMHFPEYDELYHLARDPYETQNLIAAPEYSGTAETLKKQLLRLIGDSMALTY